MRTSRTRWTRRGIGGGGSQPAIPDSHDVDWAIPTSRPPAEVHFESDQRVWRVRRTAGVCNRIAHTRKTGFRASLDVGRLISRRCDSIKAEPYSSLRSVFGHVSTDLPP